MIGSSQTSTGDTGGREFYFTYFNKYLKGQTLTLEQGETKQLATSHLLDSKVTGTGRQRGVPASAFLFEMLTSCQDP
jgi:hypothetical protein